jgi:hypothetical protein
MQIYNLVAVCWCSEIPAKPSFCRWVCSSLFTVVRVGWCTTGVDKHVLYCLARSSFIFSEADTWLSEESYDPFIIGWGTPPRR